MAGRHNLLHKIGSNIIVILIQLIIIIWIGGGIFLFILFVHSWFNPPARLSLPQPNYSNNVEDIPGYAEHVEEIKGLVHDACTGGELKTNSCQDAIKMCTNNLDCLQMVKDYQRIVNDNSAIAEETFLKASIWHENVVRAELGLPPVTE